MRRIAAAALAAWGLATLAAPLRADLVTLSFTGEVTAVDDAAGQFLGLVSPGMAISGQLVVDTAAFTSVGVRADGADYQYIPAGTNGLSFTAGTLTGAGAAGQTFTLGVYNQASAFPGISALSPIDGNGSFLALDLFDSSGLVTGTAIPSAAILAQLGQGLFQVNVVGPDDAASYLSADIGAFTVQAVPVTGVPEPGGFCLLGSALGWLGAGRRLAARARHALMARSAMSRR